jgi:hypothetical protein
MNFSGQAHTVALDGDWTCCQDGRILAGETMLEPWAMLWLERPERAA